MGTPDAASRLVSGTRNGCSGKNSSLLLTLASQSLLFGHKLSFRLLYQGEDGDSQLSQSLV